jgi:NADPH:quinone reductase-like Zn-dependent oxidoreductase
LAGAGVLAAVASAAGGGATAGGRLARGELQVHIEREFPLAQAPKALRLSEAGRVRGKLVIRP